MNFFLQERVFILLLKSVHISYIMCLERLLFLKNEPFKLAYKTILKLI